MQQFFSRFLLALSLSASTTVVGQHVAGGGYPFDIPRSRPTGFDRIPQSSFPVTGLNATDQKRVDLAIEAAHGFWIQEAETQMREVIRNHPDHPMVHMITAFIHTVFSSGDYERGLEYFRRAEALATHSAIVLSERERQWYQIMKVVYDESLQSAEERQTRHIELLEDLVVTHPQDLEAKSFLALAYWLYRVLPASDATELARIRARADSLIDEVISASLQHPVHHYKIHLWNNGRDDARAVPSARASGPAQSHTAHLWHMPAHIFTNTGDRYIAMMQSEIAHRVDHKQLLERELMPTQIHNYYHNYRDYTLGHLANSGIVNEAIERAVAMLAFGRLPHESSKRSHQTLGIKVMLLLERYQKWDTYLDFYRRGYFAGLSLEDVEATRTFEALALRLKIRALTRSTDIYQQHRSDVHLAFEHLTDLQSESSNPEADDVTLLYNEAKLWIELAHARETGVVDVGLLTQILELGITPKSQLMILARETSHDSFAKQIQESLTEQLQTLALNDLLNLYAVMRVDHPTDLSELQAVEARIVGALVPPASKIDLDGFLLTQDFPAELDQMLDAARVRHETFLDQLPSDYDYLFAKPLSYYGPADPQTWSLPLYTGASPSATRHLSTPVQGRAKVLIFAVGPSCPLCRTQIERFIAMKDQFEQKGIDLVLVTSSGEDVPELNTVRDQSKSVHRQFGVWDSFEERPLHGVILIDDRRHVRWSSKTEHAVENVGFLFDEFQRVRRFN